MRLDILRGRPAERPFCLTVAFSATHAEDAIPSNTSISRASERLYQDVDVPPPKRATTNTSNACRRSWPRRRTKAASAGTGGSTRLSVTSST